MAQDCPKCGLINPTQAQRCDCGYDFVTHQIKSSDLVGRPMLRAAGIGGVVGGALVVFVVARLVLRVFAELLGKRAGPLSPAD